MASPFTKPNVVASLTGSGLDDDALRSAQPALESVDTATDGEGSPGRAAVVSDEEEHDPGESCAVGSPPRALGAPVSSQSLLLLSVQSSEQVLEFTSRLDLSDSTAILSCLNRRGSRSLEPSAEVSKRRSPSTISTKSSSRRLSRRPSIHDDHNHPILRRGEFLYYLYSFAILGTSARVFMGRFFGEDCEHPGEVEDFMSPLSEMICVTSSGQTIQHGGALFIDLPANMLGSFLMGIVSSLDPDGGRSGGKLPWLKKDHPLQFHEGIHHAIKVGLCGSLTTFSSWNSQMLVMMDGTDTELGPQVVPAIFGYLVGLACAAWAFVIGGHVHEWLYDWNNGIKNSEDAEPLSLPTNSIGSFGHDEEQPTSFDSEESSARSLHGGSKNVIPDTSEEELHRKMPPRRVSSSLIKQLNPRRTNATICLHKVIPFLISVSCLLLYGIGVGVHNIQFYRELFACSILTPIGVHLRWKLASLNGKGIGPNHRFEWVPWGTFTTNMMAVVISAVFQALYLQKQKDQHDHPYVLALIYGMKTGCGGSLSTVSSFVKEVVNLGTVHPTHAKAYIYAAGTILPAMFLGLAIYSPMMRYT